MRQPKDITGQKFGRLTAIKMLEYSDKCHSYYWEFKCDCGKIVAINKNSVTSGHTLSCGCFRREKTSLSHKKHGLENTRLYSIWIGIKQRCQNIKNPRYHKYGGRGIAICNEWLDDFMNFYSWAMDNGYNDSLTIDRIDVNGNYEPSNCRWATIHTQAKNKTSNRLITYKNVTKCLTDWAKELKINRTTLFARIYSGWEIAKAFEKPVRTIKERKIKYDTQFC